jgi:multimeric flavodoxin WrbA
MKILAINSSYRAERGHTAFLINLLFEGAREAGAECESIALAKIRINHCLGCDQCQKNVRLLQPANNHGDLAEYQVDCVHKEKDDVQMLFNKMSRADLIIYATPIYVFNISSLLKLLLERFYGASYSSYLRATKSGLLFHHIDHALMSKPFVPLIVCDNLEDETPRTALQYFKSFSLFMEARQVGTLVRNGCTLSSLGEDHKENTRFPILAQVYAAYRQAGRELAVNGKISNSTQRRANQEIVPVPFFKLLKQIRLVELKEVFVEKARQFQIMNKP